MSVLGKKPYIIDVLSKLTDAEKTRFKYLLDNESTGATYSLVPGDSNSVPKTKPILVASAVNIATVRLSTSNTVYGILAYYGTPAAGEDQHAALISYFPKSADIGYLACYDINTTKGTFYPLNESLDIDELRSQAADADADQWVDIMKTVLSYDSETTTIEAGTNLYVDGEVRTDTITSAVKVSESNVEFAHLDTDNQWHLSGTTVCDSALVVDDAFLIVPGIENIRKDASTPLFWHGTQAQYDAITTKNADTLYIIVE